MEAVEWLTFGLISFVVLAVIARLFKTNDRVERPSEKYGNAVIDWMFG